MAAGSVAAGGLYMQTELTSMANKKLQNLGVQVEAPDQYRRPLVRKNPSKQVLPKMTKVRRLREQYVALADKRRMRFDRKENCFQNIVHMVLESWSFFVARRKLKFFLSAHHNMKDMPDCLDMLLGKPSYVGKINSKIYWKLIREQEEPPSDDSGSWKEDISSYMDQNGVCRDVDVIAECADIFPDSDLIKTSNNNAEIINVSGTQFLVDFSVFEPYPDTLLGSSDISNYYVGSREEYFLEKQKHVFNAVMRFYTNDEELICPPCIPKHVFETELEFYGLECYLHKVNAAPVADLREYKAKSRREEILLHIEFPGYSRLATAYAIFDLLMIIVSTIVLVLESVEELKRHYMFESVCYGIEVFVNVYFTIQTVVLITVYPSKKLYFSSATNWIDIVSILPFYVKLITKDYLEQVGGFRVLRLIRLLRILKLFRHSPGSQTMIHFLMTSIPEIVLLLLMWSIGVLMFGPLIYFVERDPSRHLVIPTYNLTENIIMNENLTDNLSANLTASIIWNLASNVTGNLTGNLIGSLNGNLIGNLIGSLPGNQLAYLAANLTTNLTGYITSDLIGYINGTLISDLDGNLAGNLTGKLIGSQTGDISGNLTGNITDYLVGNLVGNLNVNLIGKPIANQPTANPAQFNSAFSGMWFCVVTIGTVGYGDMVPRTEFGKILAAVYTIVNLTIMTIPISIIITKFNKSMKSIKGH